jgi:hypothetical protein
MTKLTSYQQNRRRPWLPDYLHELTVFPGSEYDDQVDSTAQTLDWLKQAGHENGWIGYYRMLNEAARMQPARPEPLSTMAKRPPPPVTQRRERSHGRWLIEGSKAAAQC